MFAGRRQLVSVFAEVLFENGETRVLHLVTDEHENVYALVDSADAQAAAVGEGELSTAQAAGEATNSSAPGPCGDAGQAPLPYRLVARLDWKFNAGSTPAANSVAAVEAALQRAATHITRSDNSCGLADEVGIGHKYLGRTTVATQIASDATCKAAGNGVNSIGFGNLPPGVLGLACVFYGADGLVTEADIRLNKASAWFAGSSTPSGCSGRFSVEAVATHEFGHVFGLGHVDEAEHGNLTMSPLINGACQTSEATLGKGDVLALRAKY